MIRTSREVLVTSDNSGDTWSASVWDPVTGSLLMTYRNPSATNHHCLSILSDSYMLAADIKKSRLYFWALNSQIPVSNLSSTTPGKVSALACAPNGHYLAAAINENIFIWQLCTGKLLRTLSRHYQTVTCLVFSSDSSRFSSGGEDSLVFLWGLTSVVNNYNDAAPVYKFSHHTGPVKDIYLGNFSQRARLVTVSLDRTARIYDTCTGTLLLTLIFDVPLTSVSMDIIECNLFVGCIDGNIRQFELRNPPRNLEYHVSEEKNLIVFKGHTGSVTKLSVSVNCTTLLSASADGNVNLWDIPSQQITRTITLKGPVVTAFFTPAYSNYHADKFESKILVRPLQSALYENDKDAVLEILTDSDCPLLNPEFYFKSNLSAGNADDIQTRLMESNDENKRLIKINNELYNNLIKNLMSSKMNGS
ncbi:WD repeat-containing protein 18 [Microplitis demolitor]|uniref:WD repeat-containing protein 18 n=1 Tax=Microplitis demolitor TaxID=69319 RepID=UPI0004CD88CD|nr:WD repeat-containing protein 18 [Microplitis demolitor]